jgi:hypothetical protein
VARVGRLRGSLGGALGVWCGSHFTESVRGILFSGAKRRLISYTWVTFTLGALVFRNCGRRPGAANRGRFGREKFWPQACNFMAPHENGACLKSYLSSLSGSHQIARDRPVVIWRYMLRRNPPRNGRRSCDGGRTWSDSASRSCYLQRRKAGGGAAKRTVELLGPGVGRKLLVT